MKLEDIEMLVRADGSVRYNIPDAAPVEEPLQHPQDVWTFEDDAADLDSTVGALWIYFPEPRPKAPNAKDDRWSWKYFFGASAATLLLFFLLRGLL